MRIITIHGSKTLHGSEGLAVRLQASAAMRARETISQASCDVVIMPLSEPAPRRSVERLVDAVEAQLVRALWTLARLPSSGGSGGGSGGRCGIPYIHERADIFANAVANGEWKKPHMGSPTPKEIDGMHEPLTWLSWLERELSEIVRAGAASKEGNADSNIAWGLVRRRVPVAREMPIRTLQRRYEAGLRSIALKKVGL